MIGKKVSPYLLLLPAIGIYLVFSLIPLAGVFRLTFFKTNFVKEEFIGLRNYERLLTDKVFWTTFGNSLLYLSGTPLTIFMGVSFAIMLYRVSERWQNYARVMVYLPGFLGAIILSATWRQIWHPEVGLINTMLGIDVPWFTSRLTSIPPIVISSMVSGWGGALIYYCAGLQAVPQEVIEAAKIDGASWRQIKYRILLPSLYRLIVLMSILAVAANFQEFYWIDLLAPYDYAATPTWLMYNTAFRFSKYGLGATYSVVLMVLILAVVMIQRWILSRWKK